MHTLRTEGGALTAHRLLTSFPPVDPPVDPRIPALERPPLGLIPRVVFEAEFAAEVKERRRGSVAARVVQIALAMHRYARAGKAVPSVWTDELLEHLSTPIPPSEPEPDAQAAASDRSLD